MLPKLYQHLTLNIPPDWSKLTFLENLLSPKAEGLQYVKGIAIMTQPDRVETGGGQESDVYGDWIHRQDRSNSTDDDPGDFHGEKFFRAKVLNTILRFILKAIPENKLQYFQYVCLATFRSWSAHRSFLQ